MWSSLASCEELHGWLPSASDDFFLAASEDTAGVAFERAGEWPGEVASPVPSVEARRLRSCQNRRIEASWVHVYLKALLDAFELSSLSFFWEGGVLTRLEAPESLALCKFKGFRVLDPRALANMDGGPKPCPGVFDWREGFLLRRRRSSMPTVVFLSLYCEGMPNCPPPENWRASPLPWPGRPWPLRAFSWARWSSLTRSASAA